MALARCTYLAPVPPPPYYRTVASALHLDALTLVTRLELLALCRPAAQLARRRCPPPLPAGPGGAPRVYSEESLLLLALLRTLWRLSYREMHDWLVAWPALAVACGLPLGPDGRPRVPSPAQQSKRLRAAGAPASELLFVLLVRAGLWLGLTCARDLIIDSTPILAWRRADPDASVGHAPARSCAGIGCIPCSAEGVVCPCSSALRRRTSTMLPSLAPCSNWPSGSWASRHASSAWMPATGASG